MAEALNNGAAASPAGQLVSPNSQAQAQPTSGGFQVPTGHRLVSESDWAVAERNREAAAGSKTFWEKAKSFGITKAEDFDRYGPAIKTMAERGIDPAMFSRSFAKEAQEELNGDKPAFDPNKFEQDLMTKMERKQAERDWQSQITKEKDIYEAAYKELKSEYPNVDDYLLRDAVIGRAEQNREVYGDGPLKGEYIKPHNESFNKTLKEYYAAEKAKHAGAAKEAKADAAIAAEKKGATTTAGRSGGNGAPDETKTKGRPGGLPSKADVEAAHEARKAMRASGRA